MTANLRLFLHLRTLVGRLFGYPTLLRDSVRMQLWWMWFCLFCVNPSPQSCLVGVQSPHRSLGVHHWGCSSKVMRISGHHSGREERRSHRRNPCRRLVVCTISTVSHCLDIEYYIHIVIDHCTTFTFAFATIR
ncbi:uncharacterized protein EV420DRAFT_445026 [Desarmillaria tabescens]|uniref:Secreted protein n=1 Tax=Armillaria tabescens TaxID=1929756 RepID=A0AA39T6L3_ARMTA|nr:uncharacterized protein EV420DRAFT_445026 [Desarmillaria tabescens]KAK0468071.1 hypothetical protein EV420DRAFT_445026 [Desarmillaria tabescens]